MSKPEVPDLSLYDAALRRLIALRSRPMAVVYGDKLGTFSAESVDGQRRMHEYRDEDRRRVAEATVDSILFGPTKTELRLRETYHDGRREPGTTAAGHDDSVRGRLPEST